MRRMQRTRASFWEIFLTRSAVPSGLLSSTTMSSQRKSRSAASISVISLGMFPTSLNVGTTTETSGDSVMETIGP